MDGKAWAHAACARLRALGGRGTPLATKLGLYLDIVPNGLPLLPVGPRWHSLELPGASPSLRFEVLDVVDVAVSKLKRFHANDRGDVRAVVELDLVPHAAFVARFTSAVDLFSGDARAEDLPRVVRNFHEVERDMFDVKPTAIDLPDWI